MTMVSLNHLSLTSLRSCAQSALVCKFDEGTVQEWIDVVAVTDLDKIWWQISIDAGSNRVSTV